jgi:hypothetical protein
MVRERSLASVCAGEKRGETMMTRSALTTALKFALIAGPAPSPAAGAATEAVDLAAASGGWNEHVFAFAVAQAAFAVGEHVLASVLRPLATEPGARAGASP